MHADMNVTRWFLPYPTSSLLRRPNPDEYSKAFLPMRNFWALRGVWGGQQASPNTLSHLILDHFLTFQLLPCYITTFTLMISLFLSYF